MQGGSLERVCWVFSIPGKREVHPWQPCEPEPWGMEAAAPAPAAFIRPPAQQLLHHPAPAAMEFWPRGQGLQSSKCPQPRGRRVREQWESPLTLAGEGPPDAV